VYVCVCVRARERERGGKRQFKIHIHSLSRRQNQTKRPAITVVNQANLITKSGCSGAFYFLEQSGQVHFERNKLRSMV
jgi:hypothetical protein